MRKPIAVRLDRRDYESLSRESLWSAEEAINLSANISMEIGKGFNQECWVQELENHYNRYCELSYQWCDSNKLIPYGKSGRNEPQLDRDKWTYIDSTFNENGEFVKQEFVLYANNLYFHKDNFVACLKELDLNLSDNLWDAVKQDVPTKIRSNRESKLVCQGIAHALWVANPEMTIAEMANQQLIMEKGGGSNFSEKARREWVSEVDPRPKDKKTGPKSQQ